MAGTNDYLKSGKYWKQDIVATQNTAATSGTSFVTVVDITGEVLVSSAELSTEGTHILEARMTRDGDVFTEQLDSSGSFPSINLVSRFGILFNNTADQRATRAMQGPSMYCKTDFKFEVRHVSGTVTTATGTVDYTTGTMENV